MNKKDLARFKKLIETERKRVVSQLDSIEEAISDRTANQASGAQGYSNHMADIGSDAMEQEQAFLHASQGSDYLRQLDDALKRIQDGTYGVCEDCGGKIPVKRLEAYLAAELCITCKSRQEKLQRS
ncbi:MAG: TraR/DksA family transcriptional regulator [Candidatus Krumholzibacteria bacterium]|nr:TraR/DksA family transcriptional regulator [Candidatus Krumholzibacteria bacterium]